MKIFFYIIFVISVFTLSCGDTPNTSATENIKINLSENKITSNGGELKITGEGFTDKIKVMIAEMEIKTRIISKQEMFLIIPPIKAGIYNIIFQKNNNNIAIIENFKIEAISLNYKKLSDYYFPDSLLNSKVFYFFDNIVIFLNQENSKLEYAIKKENDFYQNTDFLKNYIFPEFAGKLNQILPLDYDNDGDMDFFLCSPDKNVSVFWNNDRNSFTDVKTLVDFSCIKSEYKNNELVIYGSSVNEEKGETEFIKLISFNKYDKNTTIEVRKTFETTGIIIKDFHLDDINNDGKNEVLILTNENNTSKIKILSQDDIITEDITFDSDNIIKFCLIDLENDGDKDIFAISDKQDQLLLNDGFLYFFNYTNQSVPFDYSRGTALICGDLNKDGFTDIVTGNDNYSNRLYINSQKSFFSDKTISLSTEKSYSENVYLMDTDNDGNNEIIFTDKKEGLKIYKLYKEKE